MSHHVLLEYIHRAKDRGASDTDIAERLYQAGWYRVDIQDALELHRTMTRPAVLAPPTARLTSAPIVRRRHKSLAHARSHTYDPRVVPVAVLSFFISLIGYLLLVR